MKAPTRTQLQIAQELVRRGYEQKVTRPSQTWQTEYLKFGNVNHTPITVIWVSRKGKMSRGRRLISSISCDSFLWQQLKREAKANYIEED